MRERGPAEAGIVDSSAALASLYQAPLAEFVARRTTLVSQLKKSGHKDVAARLASATKPSRAAYLLNQVYWRAPAVYDGVLEAGSAARAAQQARLLGEAGEDLASTLHLRDAAVDAAVTEAERVAADEGLAPSAALSAQVRASFEAIAAHGREGRLTHGQLVHDVELPGLGALAGLVLPASAPPARQFQVVARRAGAPPVAPPGPDPRVEAAEREAVDARQREQAAIERASEVGRSLEAVRTQLGEAEAAVAAATRQLEEARRALSRGEAAHTAALADVRGRGEARAAAEAALAHAKGGDADKPAKRQKKRGVSPTAKSGPRQRRDP